MIRNNYRQCPARGMEDPYSRGVVTVCVRLDSELFGPIRRMALRQQTSVSNVLRQLLSAGLVKVENDKNLANIAIPYLPVEAIPDPPQLPMPLGAPEIAIRAPNARQSPVK